MITKIEAKNFKALDSIEQELLPFQILIGANACGKSTFLDITTFVGDIINLGLKKAIESRARTYEQLTFKNNSNPIEFAIELKLPALRASNGNSLETEFDVDSKLKTIRYEIKIIKQQNSVRIAGERLILLDDIKLNKESNKNKIEKGKVFEKITMHVYSTLLTRSENSTVSLKTIAQGQRSVPGYYLDTDKSAVSSIIEDPIKYGLHLWIKNFLVNSVKKITLDGEKLRQPGNAIDGEEYGTNGGNLPFVIHYLKTEHAKEYGWWLAHVKAALPDIVGIDIEDIPNLAQKYLVVNYSNGSMLPSWLISDGTLRILALTILPYLEDNKFNLYLVEEPENGVHPRVLESVYNSLSSVYEDQIFLATHSPLFLSIAKPKSLIIFTKDKEGRVETKSGDSHPLLQNYNKGAGNLGILFASGIFE